MEKGENIFKRKDGRREARCIKGRDVSGGIKYGSCCGKTYEEVKAKAQAFSAELQNENVPEIPEETRRFAFYCAEWLKSKKSRVKESTYVKYGQMLRKHIEPALGEYLPCRIDTEKVGEFTQKLIDAGLAAHTVKDILTTLRSLLDYTEARLPGTVPRVKIDRPPKEIKQDQRVLTREEEARLREYLLRDINESKFGVFLALVTGMRIGELCALRWENISAENRVIAIKATLQRLENTDLGSGVKTKVVLMPPQTAKSNRLIPLSENTAKLCEMMRPADEEAYVLTGTRNYLDVHTLRLRFKRYARDCGLEGVHFRALRHTFAARCIEVGFEIKALSEILGYSTAKIPLDTYVRSSMELKRSNMEKLSAIGL